jgi:hypothetical protein
MEDPKFVPDSIVQTIIGRFQSRAEFGWKKYNTTLDRTDLTPEQWAQHAIEEAHDLMLYLEKWKQEQAKMKRLVELLINNMIIANDVSDVKECYIHYPNNKEEFLELIHWYHEKNQTS